MSRSYQKLNQELIALLRKEKKVIKKPDFIYKAQKLAFQIYNNHNFDPSNKWFEEISKLGATEYLKKAGRPTKKKKKEETTAERDKQTPAEMAADDDDGQMCIERTCVHKIQLDELQLKYNKLAAKLDSRTEKPMDPSNKANTLRPTNGAPEVI